MPIQLIYLKNGPNWPNWLCCLVGSSKNGPRGLIFSIVLGAEYSFYVKYIATYAPQFIWYNNSVEVEASYSTETACLFFHHQFFTS
jgi:hypothetical protein